MGIDTVSLRSPSINEGLAQTIERTGIMRSGIELSSGDVLYELTSSELEGSWDSRISLRICREDYVSHNGRVVLAACEPFIKLEASIHKFHYGQNVFGQVTGFADRIETFINLVGELLKGDAEDPYLTLPTPAEWQVRRVDWAEVYRLTPAAIAEFFRSLSQCRFPRRASAKFGENAIHCPGKTTTLKLYHKGPEFREHDRSRLRRALTAYYLKMIREWPGKAIADHNVGQTVERKLKALQRLAENRLRVEVGINADKLLYDFGSFPKVSDITDEYLKKVHDDEVFKLLREGKSEMETVRTHDAVKARLNSCYGKRSANSLFSFWLQMAARGESVVRGEYSKGQYYDNRKKLVDVGVSWLASNIYILPDQTALPKDFRPLRADARRCESLVSNASVFNFCPVEYGNIKAA